jgi:hypothetical protein
MLTGALVQNWALASKSRYSRLKALPLAIKERRERHKSGQTGARTTQRIRGTKTDVLTRMRERSGLRESR